MGWNIKYPYVNDEVINLDWVLSKLREFEAKLNQWAELAAELESKLQLVDQFDSRITALEQDSTLIHAEINLLKNRVTTLESDVEALKKQDLILQAEIDQINLKYNGIVTDINSIRNDVKVLYNYVDAKVKAAEEKLLLAIDEANYDNIKHFKEIDREIALLKKRVDALDTFVVNPWHPDYGKISLQKNNKLIYNDLSYSCPTASEYVKLGLTAEAYSKFKLTAYEYAKFGKKMLHYFWVFSPVYGWKQDINNVLTSIMNNIHHTMDAQAYSELGLTAEQYSNIGLTALQYYGWQPERTGIYVLDGALQSDVYYLGETDGVLEFAGVTATETDGVLEFS